jgi:hypothetical protein
MLKQTHKTSLKSMVTKYLSRSFRLVLFLVALTGVFLYTRAGTPVRVEAATSSNLNFQARILSAAGALVPDGNYHIEFKLHDHASNTGGSQGACSGSCLWRETRSTGNLVTVRNGYLSVNLGSVTAFPAINWDQDLWLSMNIGGTSGPTWDGEMSPRIKLTAVPYAFKSGGITSYNGTQSGNLSFNTVANSPNILLPDIGGTNNVLLQSGTTLFTQGSIPFTGLNGLLTQDNTSFFFDDSTDRLGIGDNTPAYTLTVGAGDLFGVQGADGSLIWEGSSADANETILRVQNPTADLIFELPDVTAGTYEVCTDANNCASLGAYIQNGTSLQSNANFNIQSVADGSITAQIRARASQTADLLQFRNSGDTAALSGFTANGSLYFVDPTGGETVTLSVQNASISTNRSITLPNADGEICTTSGNCIGNGGAGDVFKNGQTGPLIIGTNDNTSFYLESGGSNRIEIQGDGDVWSGNSLRVTGSSTSVLTGSIDPTASTSVTGVSTLFLSELTIGDRIIISGETRTVTAIASNTALTVDTAFTDNANDTAPDRLAAELSVRNSSGVVDFVIQDNGAVGIGTSTPGAKLNVIATSGGSEKALVVNNSTSTGNILELQDNGTTVFTVADGGLVSFTQLGTASNDTVLCRNGSSQIATCNNTFATGSGVAFLQGGNTFSGTTAGTLGTVNNGDLNLITNNTTRLNIQANGAANYSGALRITTTSSAYTTGAGIELKYEGAGYGNIQAYDHDSSLWKSISINDSVSVEGNNGRVLLVQGGTAAGAASIPGNVGLEIRNGNAAGGASLTLEDGQVGGRSYSLISTTGNPGLYFRDDTASAYRAMIDANGLFGIGTITPGAQLQVAATNGTNGGTGTAGTAGLIVTGGNGGNSSTAATAGAAGGAISLTAGNGGNSTGVAGTNGANITLQAGAGGTGSVAGSYGNILLNTAGGNVGIGDTSPAALLTVGNGDKFQVSSIGELTFSGVTTDITTGTNEDLTVIANGTGQIILNDTVQVATLGTASNDTVLCRNGSNQIAACSSIFATTPVSGNYLFQVPATTAANTITPTANSVVGLTVNGTSGTAATALNVIQGGNATAVNISGNGVGTKLSVADSTSTTGNTVDLSATSASQTTTTILNIAQSGVTTGYTGNVVNIQGTSTTGAGNLVNLTSANTTAGNALNVTANALTTGKAVNINSTSTGLTTGSLLTVSSATTGAIATNGIVSLNATGNYTSTSNVGLLNVSANATTAGTVAKFSGTALTTGQILNITSGTSLTTGTALNLTGASYNPGAGNTGNLINVAFTNNSNNTSGVSVVAGLNIAPTLTSTGIGGTHETYGVYLQSLAGSPSGAGTQNNYGIRIGNQGKTNTETSYGLFINSQAGSTNSYAAIFEGGNVGIGTTSPPQDCKL